MSAKKELVKYVSPTGRTYWVPSARFQERFLYEFHDDKSIETVWNDYRSGEAHWTAMFGPNSLLPYTNDEAALGPVWNFTRDIWTPAGRKTFVAENIVKLDFGNLLPQKDSISSTFDEGWDANEKRVAVDEPNKLRCHRKIKPQLTRALARVFAFADKVQYRIHGFHSFEWREIDKDTLSNHCLGVAIDINATWNAQRSRIWDMPKEIVRIMMEEGFWWGGNYKNGIQDPMHFEYRLPLGLERVGPTSVPIHLPLAGRVRESPIKYYRNTEDAATGVGGYYGVGLNRNLHGGVHLFPGQTEPSTVHAMAPGYVVAVRLPKVADKAGENEVSHEVLGKLRAWTGFVLVRHDVSLRKDPAKPFDPKDDRALYSLYMHLVPLGPDLTKDSYFKNVPWFGDLVRRRFGTFTKVFDDDKESAGTTYWSRVPLVRPEPGKKYGVFGATGKEEVEAVDESGHVRWFFKAAPVDFAAVMKEIDSGKLVTFHEPFFCVQEGDPVGVVAPIPSPSTAKTERTGKPKGVRYRKASGEEVTAQITSGFLHWEIFAPLKDGKSSVQDILALVDEAVAELKNAFPKADVVTETTEDNFLEIDELGDKVVPRLPKDDRPPLEKTLEEMKAFEKKHQVGDLRMAGAVIELFANRRSFSPQTKGDAQEVVEKPPAGAPPPAAVVEPFTYPLELQLELDGLLPPDQVASRQPYQIKIIFLKRATGGLGANPDEVIGKQNLTIDPGLFGAKKAPDPFDGEKAMLSFTLRVPADADRVRLVGPDGGDIILGEPARDTTDDGARLLKNMASCRWRGTRLSHLNEWSPSSVAKLFDKLKEKKILPPEFDTASMGPLAWWGGDKATTVSRAFTKDAPWAQDPTVAKPLLRDTEEKTVRPNDKGPKSLFGSEPHQLPPDGKVDNLHPVTMAWLLAILQNRGLAEVKPARRAVFHKEDPQPAALGWVPDAGAPVPQLGQPLHVLAIDDDFGYDRSVELTISAVSDGKRIAIAKRQHYAEGNGVFHHQVVADFWGKWKLAVEGAKKEPKVVGLAEVDLPPPVFLDTDADDALHRRHVPRRHGRHVVWCFKTAPKAPIPRELRGFIGVELSKDGGKSWHEPAINGNHLCLIATAHGTPSKPELALNTEDFEIKDDCILGLAVKPPPFKPTPADPNVTKSFRYSTFRKAATDINVSCSLVHALHEVGADQVEVRSLDWEGVVCVLGSSSWPKIAAVAARCLDSGLFEGVAILGESAPLTRAELNEKAPAPTSDRMKALHRNGLLARVKHPLTPANKLPSIIRDKVQLTFDELHVTGTRGKTTEITSRIKRDHLVHRTNPRISCVLAQGLEELRSRAKKDVRLIHLSWEGDSCLLPGTDLLDEARELPHFARVFVEKADDGKENVRIFAPPVHGMMVHFDPSKVLAALREHEVKAGALKKEGERVMYRFYFCAVNGFSFVRPGEIPHELLEYAEQESFGLPSKKPPHVAIARCLVPSGGLQTLAFGKATAQIFEKEIHVAVELKGNSWAWAGAEVEFRGKGIKKALQSKVVPGETAVRTVLPLPKEESVELELKVVDGSPDLMVTPPTAPAKVELAPKLVADPKTRGLTFTPIDDYIVIWCRTENVEIPKKARAETPFAWDNSKRLGQPGIAQARTPNARELVLSLIVKPPKTADARPPRIEYYVPAAYTGGGGYVNQDGIFAARVRKADLSIDKTYLVALKGKIPVRGKEIPPLKGEIDPSIRGPLAQDGPFGDLRILEDAAIRDGYHDVVRRITAFRKIWYPDGGPIRRVAGVLLGGGPWRILIEGAAATEIPPSWRQGELAALAKQVASVAGKVRDLEGGRTDIAHLFTGLDAANHLAPVVIAAGVVNMRSNREATTFVGDLGSVVATYIHRCDKQGMSFHDTALKRNDAVLKKSYDDLAGPPDMNANADAFALRFEPTRTIVETLEAYYRPGSSALARRYCAMREYLKGTDEPALRNEVFEAAIAFAASQDWLVDIANIVMDKRARTPFEPPTFREAYMNVSGWVVELFLQELTTKCQET